MSSSAWYGKDPFEVKRVRFLQFHVVIGTIRGFAPRTGPDDLHVVFRESLAIEMLDQAAGRESQWLVNLLSGHFSLC